MTGNVSGSYDDAFAAVDECEVDECEGAPDVIRGVLRGAQKVTRASVSERIVGAE